MLVIVLLSLALVGCGSRADGARAPSNDKPPRADKPPAFEFVAPKTWRSKRQDSPPVEPPDLSLETWRVLVNQDQPIQIKTPQWQLLPAKETVELSMPPGSAYRCMVAPLEVSADANDFGTKLKGWSLVRRFLCSSDGFASWTEYRHGLRVLPDGSRDEAVPETGALLRERDAAQVVRHTAVLLRTSPERVEATTGPPKIMPGVVVDE